MNTRKMYYDRPDRAMLTWTKKEIAMLVAHWVTGSTVPELAAMHKRSYRAIVMQLEAVMGENWQEWNTTLWQRVKMLERKLNIERHPFLTYTK